MTIAEPDSMARVSAACAWSQLGESIRLGMLITAAHVGACHTEYGVGDLAKISARDA